MVERNPHDDEKQATVLVDSGTSGNYFDEIILELKHRLLHRIDLTVPCNFMTAVEFQLDGTSEGVLQGIVTREYGNPNPVYIGILTVSGIGSNFYSIKAAASKGITILLRVGENNLSRSCLT